MAELFFTGSFGKEMKDFISLKRSLGTVRDVDLHQGILTVRDSKNHNSRLVPMSKSMTLRLRRYAERHVPVV